jgi:hypothetical protein
MLNGGGERLLPDKHAVCLTREARNAPACHNPYCLVPQTRLLKIHAPRLRATHNHQQMQAEISLNSKYQKSSNTHFFFDTGDIGQKPSFSKLEKNKWTTFLQ